MLKKIKYRLVLYVSESHGTFRFAHTNPLHLDVFQSVVRFEAEVVAMTAALLGSKEKSSGGQICGNMTSGGTESILLAVKSSRDYVKSKRGITRPEMYVTNKFIAMSLVKCRIFTIFLKSSSSQF